MKKILLLLLLITSVSYGQAIAPTRVKITNNVVSPTAPFVGVQENDGFVNKINKSDLIEVLEYASAINLPVTGVAGKIYVTLDNNRLYRWTGTIYQDLGYVDISNKVDKVTGKSLISDTEITRLATLSNYTHPTNHPPSIITQDASNRFVTDAEKTAWNAKQSALGYTPANALDVVHKAGEETITGAKTFSSLATFDASFYLKQGALSSYSSIYGTDGGVDFAGISGTPFSAGLRHNYFAFGSPSIKAVIFKTALTATRNFNLPNQDGIFALTENPGTVSSGTITAGNTPPTANNQLTRKDYVDAGLALKENVVNKNVANGYAGLGPDGKLISSQLPSITISDTYVVASEVAMLGLTGAEKGDVAVRTDLNKSFILKGNSYSTLADWQELLTPTSAVTTVFGRNGAVTAQTGDYTATMVGAPSGSGTSTGTNTGDQTSVSGNAGTATVLQTARTINGVSFNGSTNITVADATKEPSFTKNTGFNKNFGTTVGTVAEGNDSRILNGQTAFGWGNHAGLYLPINATASNSTLWNGNAFYGGNVTPTANIAYGIVYDFVNSRYGIASSEGYKSWLGLGSNAYTSTAYLPLAGGTLTGNLKVSGGTGITSLTISNSEQDNATDTAELIFKQATNQIGTASGGKIVSGREGVYGGSLSNHNSFISFYTATNDIDTEKLRLASNGSATFSSSVMASGFFNSSDRRLKTILKRDGDVAYFKWKDGRDSKIHIGYIAQEVRRKFPDQVQKGEDKMLSVNYVEILVEKVRMLEKRIKQLEKR